MFEDLIVTRGRYRVELVHIGEGYNGDYDPEEPGDQRLIRIDAYEASDEHPDVFEPIDKGSYCTVIPITAPEDFLLYCCGKALEALRSEAPILNLQKLTWTEPPKVAP